MLIIAIALIVCNFMKEDSDEETLVWSNMELGNIIPQPVSNKGKILINTDDMLSVYIYKTSSVEYNEYLERCQSQGFMIDSDKWGNNYSAYDEDGYKLALWYSDSDEELHIGVDAPMEMEVLQWPGSDIANSLPIPKSDIGKIVHETSEELRVYVGRTSIEDYKEYIKNCTVMGFDIDYEKGDKYYRANNAEGYHIELNYQGANVMLIQIDSPKEAWREDEGTSTDQPSTTEVPIDANVPENIELIDGMRPEFKEAMDSYEEFYEEYCDLLKEYYANPMDMSLMTKYYDMLEKVVEVDEKFEAWNEKDMNDAELKYYLEVTNRIAQKMLDVMM